MSDEHRWIEGLCLRVSPQGVCDCTLFIGHEGPCVWKNDDARSDQPQPGSRDADLRAVVGAVPAPALNVWQVGPGRFFYEPAWMLEVADKMMAHSAATGDPVFQDAAMMLRYWADQAKLRAGTVDQRSPAVTPSVGAATHKDTLDPPLAPSERVAQAPVFLSVDGARWLVRQTCSHTMSRDFSLRLERLILAVSQAQDARIAWQKIETAPKDGTHVLTWTKRGAIPASYRVYGKWGTEPGGDEVTPTHWLPLPAPPSDPTP